jgi:hypothetical protein
MNPNRIVTWPQLLAYTMNTTSQIASFPAASVDAFSRLRVASPAYRFDSQLTYQIDADLWDSSTATSGTIAHDSAMRAATLTAAASNGSKAILQSHYCSPYTPGRGQLGFVTFLFGATPSSGVSRRAGLYDETLDQGFYLEQTATGVNLVLRTGGTGYAHQSIAKADWNIDPLDGTGPSGITLDLSDVQILVIQFQALYVGRVTIGFDIGGTVVPVHVFDHANVISAPYIANANLPVHYSIRTTAANGGTLKAICASVISEGGDSLSNMPGRNFVSTGTVSNAASGTLLVIRAKAQLNSINQTALAIPTGMNIAVADAGCWVEVRRNATVTAGDFTDVDGTYSMMQESYAGNGGTDPTVTAGTGQLLTRLYIPASQTLRATTSSSLLGKVILNYSHLLSAADTLSLLYDTGGATTDVYASLEWKEIR